MGLSRQLGPTAIGIVVAAQIRDLLKPIAKCKNHA